MEGYAIKCGFSLDGTILASGSSTGSAHFYDYHTAHMLHTLRAHSQPCLCVSQHPVLPTTVATCDWGGEIKVWHWQPTMNKEIINLKRSWLAMRWKTVLNRNVMCTFIFKTIAFIISWQKIRRTWQKMLKVSKSTIYWFIWKTFFYTDYLAKLSHHNKKN